MTSRVFRRPLFPSLAARILLFAALVVAAFVALLPLIYLLSTSLKTYGETVTRVNPNPFNPNFWPTVPQFTNYVQAWVEGEGLAHGFLNSLIIGAVSLAGTFVTTIPAAYAFARIPFAGRNIVFNLFIVTLMIPETLSTLANFITVTTLKLNNTLGGLTLPFFASAFFIFFLRQYFMQIPETFIESARLDGARTIQIVTRIAVPLARAPIFTIGFLAFTESWNALMWPLMVANKPDWRPLSVNLMAFISEAGPQTHLSMAAAAIALVPVVLTYIVAQKQITESISSTGIKG